MRKGLVILCACILLIALVGVCSFIKTEYNIPVTVVKADAENGDLCSFKDYVHGAMPHEVNGELAQKILSMRGWTVTEQTKLAPDEEFALFGCSHYTVKRQTKAQRIVNKNTIICSRSEDQEKYLKDIDKQLDLIIFCLNIDNSTPEKEALRKINSFICSYLEYSLDDLSGDLLQALETKKGTCAVYSSLFQLLCQRCGIECYFIHDLEHNHAYNRVHLSNGEIYYFDVTWNDTTTLMKTKFSFCDLKTFQENHRWDSITP